MGGGLLTGLEAHPTKTAAGPGDGPNVELSWRGLGILGGTLTENASSEKSDEGNKYRSVQLDIRHQGPAAKTYHPVEATVRRGKQVSSVEVSGKKSSERLFTATVLGDLAPGSHRFKVRVLGAKSQVLESKTATVTVRTTVSLHQSAPTPNPGRSMVTVRFAVVKHSQTRINLYNVLGQRVRTLYRGELLCALRARVNPENPFPGNGSPDRSV